MKADNLALECHLDTLFFTLLGFTSLNEVHFGFGFVSKTMKNLKEKGKTAIGVIDNDSKKNQADYFWDFISKEKFGNIEILEKKDTENCFLIKIGKNDIEGWLIEMNQKLAQPYKINDKIINGKYLKGKSKDRNLKYNQGIIDFLNHLIQAEPPEILYLKANVEQLLRL